MLDPGMQSEFRVVNQTLRVNIIPEPASLSLAGCGFLSLLGARRRRV